jgi:4-amino-4-deoxy-L-arabinose transferase-like glycosyltransferase
MDETRTKRPVSLAPTLAGLAIRVVVAFGLLGGLPLVSDALSYSDFARDLLSSFPGKDAYYWPPGNSLLLAAAYAVLGASPWVAKGVMVLLGTAAVPLTARVARELDPRAEASAAWTAALYPPAVMLVAESYAQHLSAVCILAFAWLGLRAMRERRVLLFALAGLALGAGCLTRPSMASLAPVLLGFFVTHAWRARRERAALAKLVGGGAVLVIVAAALVLPAALHNARLGAGLTVSTNNERNLFLGNNPYTPDYKTSHLGQRSLDELDPETRVYLASFYARPDARAAMQREALSYMAGHPGKTALRTLNRATSFWGFDYLASRIVQEDRGWGKKALLPMLALEAGGYLAAAALAILGLFAFAAEEDRGCRTWLGWLVLAYEAPYAIAFSGGTYHFPAMALLVPFAGVAWARRSQIAARLREKKAALVVLALFAFVQAEYAYYAVLMAG